ncbi:hypothetical protein ACJX0J_002667 [Zea mays]
MLLAGILLKMGAYGLIRVNMELLPHAHYSFSPWLVIMERLQIIYAASTSLGQRNFKKRIAYSSVSHHGYFTNIYLMDLSGANNFFFLAGTACDRMRLVYLEELGRNIYPNAKNFYHV